MVSFKNRFLTNGQAVVYGATVIGMFCRSWRAPSSHRQWWTSIFAMSGHSSVSGHFVSNCPGADLVCSFSFYSSSFFFSLTFGLYTWYSLSIFFSHIFLLPFLLLTYECIRTDVSLSAYRCVIVDLSECPYKRIHSGVCIFMDMSNGHVNGCVYVDTYRWIHTDVTIRTKAFQCVPQ